MNTSWQQFHGEAMLHLPLILCTWAIPPRTWGATSPPPLSLGSSQKKPNSIIELVCVGGEPAQHLLALQNSINHVVHAEPVLDQQQEMSLAEPY